MADASVRKNHEVKALDENQRIECAWSVEDNSLVVYSVISHVVVHHVQRFSRLDCS